MAATLIDIPVNIVDAAEYAIPSMESRAAAIPRMTMRVYDAEMVVVELIYDSNSRAAAFAVSLVSRSPK